MNQHLVRSDIKNCTSIYYHKDYHLFSGKYLQICSRQGGSLSKYPSVRNYLTAIAPFPNTKLLVEDGKCVYHVLDLEEGTVLASQKMRRDVSGSTRFAVSEDGKTAYRIWLHGRKHELVVIDLPNLSYRIYPYHACLSCVADVLYTKERGLLVLECQVDEDRTCQNQVTSVQIEGEECKTLPLHTWSGEHTAKFFDGRYVWESGYQIHDLHTDYEYGLLDNSDILLPKNHVALTHTYYPDKNYLQIVDGNKNIFIDCTRRQIIASYSTNPQDGSYCGILVGDEFWIGKSDGIYALPFPLIENS